MTRRGCTRRFARGAGQASNPANASRILALSPYSFIDSETYAIDGVSGNVASWTDKVAAGTGIRAIDASHAYSQATSARQVAVPSASALFAGKVAASCTNAYYESTAPASAWQCSNDGTGFTEYYVLAPSTVAAGNAYVSNTQVANIQWAVLRSTDTLAVFLRDSTNTVIMSPIASTVAANAGQVWKVSYSESESPEGTARIGTQTANTANTTAPPTASAPGKAQGIFAHAANSAPFTGQWVAKITFDRIVSAAHDAVVRSYITAKYGVT